MIIFHFISLKGGETMNIKSTLTKCLVVLSILLMTISPISAAEANAKSVATATNGGTATAISGAEAYGHDANAKACADAYANGPGAIAYSEAFAKDIRPYVRPYCCNTCYPTRYHTTTICSVPMSN